MESVDDPRPGIPHDAVVTEMDAEIVAIASGQPRVTDANYRIGWRPMATATVTMEMEPAYYAAVGHHFIQMISANRLIQDRQPGP